MSVHQRKNDRWIAKFSAGFLSDDPGLIRHSFGRGIPSEAAALIRHAPEHSRRLPLIAYDCGARPGASELLSLTWDRED
jgi:integrase